MCKYYLIGGDLHKNPLNPISHRLSATNHRDVSCSKAHANKPPIISVYRGSVLIGWNWALSSHTCSTRYVRCRQPCLCSLD